jgi:2-acylglycerol O-acyltransferase 2
LSNERGTRLYKLQKRFQAAFGFTLRAPRPSPSRTGDADTLIASQPSSSVAVSSIVRSLPEPRLLGSALNFPSSSDNVGILPYRHPIVSVVGRPIRVTQVDNPTMSQMEEVQAQYIVELKR